MTNSEFALTTKRNKKACDRDNPDTRLFCLFRPKSKQGGHSDEDETKKIIALVIVIMFRPRGIMGSREFALCDIPRWPAKLRAWRTARSEGRSVQKEAKRHV